MDTEEVVSSQATWDMKVESEQQSSRINSLVDVRNRFNNGINVTKNEILHAVKDVRRLLDEKPDHEAARFELARALAWLPFGNKEEALDHFRNLVMRHTPKAHHLAHAAQLLVIFPRSRAQILEGERYAEAYCSESHLFSRRRIHPVRAVAANLVTGSAPEVPSDDAP